MSRIGSQSFDWRLFAHSLAGIRWTWMLGAFFFILATYYGRALRWAVLLRPICPRPSMRNLLSATVIGFAALMLFGRPGEMVRPYLIAVKERVSLASQLAAWVLERIFDLLMALLVFGFALARIRGSGVTVGPGLAWVMAVGGRFVTVSSLALLALLLAFRHLAEPMRRRLSSALRFLPDAQRQRIERLVGAFAEGVESTRSDWALLLLLIYSVLEWALVAACYWCMARAFADSITLSLTDVLIFMGFVTFGSVVQIPGVGGGMQVTAVVVLTELFGARLEVATMLALMIWIITFVAIVPVGLAAAVKEGLNWRSLRQIRQEVSE